MSTPDGALRGRTAALASVLDQGAAGLTNILVLVLAARLSTVSGFARFSMVYLVFTVVLGLFMAYVGQALVLERGSTAERAAACRGALGFTAVAACAVGAALVAAGAVAPPSARALAALGAVLPVVLLQDAARYCFSLLGRPHHALAADGLRLGCTVAVLAVQPDGASPVRLVLAWGLAALPGLLLALALLRSPLRGGGGRTCGAMCGAATWDGGSPWSSPSATAPASSRCSASACWAARRRWARCGARRRCSAR